MRYTIYLLSFCLFAQISLAQAPSIQWQRCLGGQGREDGRSFVTTADGGYIIAGSANSLGYGDFGDVGSHRDGGSDLWVMKINNTGTIQWQTVLGGFQSEGAASIKSVADGGYIIAGYTESVSGDVMGMHGDHSTYSDTPDMWVIKLNNIGVMQWQRCLGGYKLDYAYSVDTFPDGSFLIGGMTRSTDGDVVGNHGGSDAFLVKLDGLGNILWKRAYGGSGGDAIWKVKVTSDGGCILIGTADSDNGDLSGVSGPGLYWVAKLNSAGNIEWQNKSNQKTSAVTLTADNKYIIAGAKVISGRSADLWVAKLNQTGIMEWEKTFGGTNYDEAWDVRVATDGSLLITGTTESNDGDVTGWHGQNDVWLVRTSSDGNLRWQKCLGGTELDSGVESYFDSDGAIVLLGNTHSNDGDVVGNHVGGLYEIDDIDMWVVKLAPEQSIKHHYFNPNATVLKQRLISGTQPYRVCADGSNVSVFSARGMPTGWKFRIKEDPDGVNADQYGYFSFKSDTAYTYTHPIVPPASGLYKEYHIELVNATGTSVYSTFELQIYRAPLLLVHGKADNGKSYNVMHGTLLNNELYTRDLMLKVDYQGTNNNIFSDNENVLRINIDFLLGNVVERKFAAGKVDIVAHSMGGLLSRIYLQSDTYMQDINKLITHNTPHSGAHSANRLADPIFAATARGGIARYAGDWGGAAFDLQVGSGKTIANTINNPGRLNKNKVPIHAIATTFPHNPPPDPSTKYGAVRKGYNMSMNDLFRNDSSDFVVSYESQLGGLTGTHTSLIRFQVHSQAQENIQLINNVINLLKANPKDNSFTSKGYAPKLLEYVAPQVINNTVIANSPNGSINIGQPLATKIINKGAQLQFSVNGTNLDSINVFIKATEGNWVLLTSPGNNLLQTTTIDSRYTVGKYKFIAIGYCTNGEPVFQEGTFTVVDCKDSYSLQSAEITNSDYQARNTIMASGKVVFGENILMTAGKSIEFKPGFEATNYTKIEAGIKGCDSN